MAAISALKTVGFESMLPLDMLAAVASETLQLETNLKNQKQCGENAKEKNATKPIRTKEIFTYDEIKTMSSEKLLHKFCIVKYDENRKKYHVICKLLPKECKAVYKSLGNEARAMKKMKSHLIRHLNDLSTSEQDLLCFKSVSDTTFEPIGCKSTLKQPRKQNIKCLKQYSEFPRSNTKQNCHKNSRATCNLESNLLNNKFSERKVKKKCRKAKHINAVFADNIRGYSDPIDKYIRDQLTESSCMFTDFDENHSSLFTSSNQDILVINDTHIVNDNCVPWPMEEHNYSSINGIKVDLPTKPQKKITNRHKKLKVLPQFIIKTPPFPYIHIPDPYIVIEICEIDSDCQPVPKIIEENFSFLEGNSNDVLDEDMENDFIEEDIVFSVLECVENKFDMTSLPSVMVDCYDSVDSNTENEDSENIQKIEKELALNLISKLCARKKQLSGSLQCEICPDKQFTVLATLIQHYKSHAGIKPYSCSICDSTFTRQHSLNYHMLIHQNRSRFACEYCGRTFRHPSHYKEHLRRHTGESPFHCSDCNMVFKTRNTFKRHLKMQHHKLLTANGPEELLYHRTQVTDLPEPLSA